MRSCAALLLCLAGSALAQAAHPRPVTLAVHILVACTTLGAHTASKVQTPDGALCLDAKPFLTQDDVETAEIQPGSNGRPQVFLTFHADAAMRELQVTRKNIGNHVAIVLDGKVVGSPRISAASRLLYIDNDFTREQADAVVSAFNRQIAARKK